MLPTLLIYTALIQSILVSAITIFLVSIVILVVCIEERMQFNTVVLNWSTSRFVNYVACARNCWSKHCAALVRCHRPLSLLLRFITDCLRWWAIYYLVVDNKIPKTNHEIGCRIKYYATSIGDGIRMMREELRVVSWVGSGKGAEHGEGVEKKWKRVGRSWTSLTSVLDQGNY